MTEENGSRSTCWEGQVSYSSEQVGYASLLAEYGVCGKVCYNSGELGSCDVMVVNSPS